MLINCLVPNGETENPAEIELDYAALPEVGEIIIHNDIRYEVEKRYYISYSATEDKPAGVSYMLELAEKEIEPHIPVVTDIMLERDAVYPDMIRIFCEVDGVGFRTTAGRYDLLKYGICYSTIDLNTPDSSLIDMIIDKWVHA